MMICWVSPELANIANFAEQFRQSLIDPSHSNGAFPDRVVSYVYAKDDFMHWIERPPEPSELWSIRSLYTGPWIRYHRQGIDPKPNDTRWRRFVPVLRRAFGDVCAYCEETCKPEVEHFRPISLYPWLVYRWSNWLLACHDCNNAKRSRWPSTGYVDPCAEPLNGNAGGLLLV